MFIFASLAWIYFICNLFLSMENIHFATNYDPKCLGGLLFDTEYDRLDGSISIEYEKLYWVPS